MPRRLSRSVRSTPSPLLPNRGGGRIHEREELRSELARADVDGVLIFSWVRVDERHLYIDSEPYDWDVARSPTTSDYRTYVIVESSLYDTRTDRLLWTAESETVDGRRFISLAGSIANEVTGVLVARDILVPQK